MIGVEDGRQGWWRSSSASSIKGKALNCLPLTEISCWLFVNPPYRIKKVPFFSRLAGSLLLKSWMDIEFIKCFFCHYWDTYIIFVFKSTDVVNKWLFHVKPILISLSIQNLVINLFFPFTCCWIKFVNILFQVFPFMFMNEIDLKFSFLILSFLRFNSRVFSAHEFWIIPSSSFWKGES